jgi:hypothetical protein
MDLAKRYHLYVTLWRRLLPKDHSIQVVGNQKDDASNRQPSQKLDVFGSIGCEVDEISSIDQEVVQHMRPLKQPSRQSVP